MVSDADFRNPHLLRDEDSRNSLRGITEMCSAFGANLPRDEEEQAEGLKAIIARIGEDVRQGILVLGDVFSETEKINRLYKSRIGQGRLKLQLFSLTTGESHPPHAHGNLLSCQVVLEGRARIREFSLLNRLEGERLEIQEHPVQYLEPGQGVYTLQFRNNIHWQEGLSDETVLLNINWQGFLPNSPLADRYSVHGRCFIDFSRAENIGGEGHYIVPEVMSRDDAHIG